MTRWHQGDPWTPGGYCPNCGSTPDENTYIANGHIIHSDANCTHCSWDTTTHHNDGTTHMTKVGYLPRPDSKSLEIRIDRDTGAITVSEGLIGDLDAATQAEVRATVRAARADCEGCRTDLGDDEDGNTIYQQGEGCEDCNYSGYIYTEVTDETPPQWRPHFPSMLGATDRTISRRRACRS